MTRRLTQLPLLSVLLLASVACVPPPTVTYVVKGEPEGIPVSKAPPPPLEEHPTAPPPGEGWTWQDGYWRWDEGTEAWAWIPGQWVMPPAAEYVFVVAATIFIDGGWLYRPAFWCHRDYRYGDSYRGHRWHPTGGRHHGRHGGHGRTGGEHATRGGRDKGRGSATSPGPAGGGGKPSAASTVRVRAPKAAGEAPIAGSKPSVHAKAPPAPKGPQRTARVGSGGRPTVDAIDIHASGGRRATAYRKNPSYLGMRDGRPRFGDDPRGTPRYRRATTGAIALSERWRAARRRSRAPMQRLDPHVRAAREPIFVRGPKVGVRATTASPRYHGGGSRAFAPPSRSHRSALSSRSSRSSSRSYSPSSGSRSSSSRSSSRSSASRNSSHGSSSRSSGAGRRR